MRLDNLTMQVGALAAAAPSRRFVQHVLRRSGSVHRGQPMKRIRSWMRPAALCLSVALSALGMASDRDETIAILDTIPSTWHDAKLEVWLNAVRNASSDRTRNEVVLGGKAAIKVSSTVPGYLILIHVDSTGVARILRPTPDAKDSLLAADNTASFPYAGLEAKAEPPIGPGDVFAFATAVPVTLADLGVDRPPDESGVMIDELEARHLAEKLKAALANKSADKVAVARLKLRILGRNEGSRSIVDEQEYSVDDIVDFFRDSRGIKRRRLPMQVQFDFNKAILTDDGMSAAERLAEAFERPELVSKQFVLAGHTDDVGTDEYNLELSRRRAEAMKKYLVEKGIAADRLKIEGFGEAQPLEEGDSDQARAANRRVEVIKDDSTAGPSTDHRP